MSVEEASGSATSKLESLSREDLIKLIKKYVILQKQLKSKNEELATKLNDKNAQDLMVSSVTSTTSTDDLLEREKIKELQYKINEINKTNVELVNENLTLKNTIENLQSELEKQNQLVKNLEEFKNDLEPELEKARNEIGLNKSMLEMLNNEIQLLSTEKLQLENRLLGGGGRRGGSGNKKTPSVIIEEDEEEEEEFVDDEDLVEGRDEQEEISAEATNDDDKDADDYEKQQQQQHSHHQNNKNKKNKRGVRLQRMPTKQKQTRSSKALKKLNLNPTTLEKIIETIEEDDDEKNNEESGESGEEAEKATTNCDYELEKRIIVKKDMTFYVDELKSELEAERERNVEYAAQIDSLRAKLSELDHSLKSEMKQSDASNEPGIESTTKTNCEQQQQQVRAAVDTAAATEKFLRAVIEHLNIDEQENFKFEKSTLLNDFVLNDEQQQLNRSLSTDLIEHLSNLISRLQEKCKQECDRVVYVENRLANVIKDFKSEIASLELKLDENQKEYLNFKIQADEKLKAIQEKAEKENSKTKLRDLEIADYEKTVKSLNAQISSKDKEIADLKQEASNSNSTLNKLKNDLETMTNEKDLLNEKFTKTKQIVAKLKKDATEAKQQEYERINQDASSKLQLEQLNLEIDNYKVQLAELSAEKLKLLDRIKSLNESHSLSVDSLVLNESKLRDQLNETRSQLDSIKAEYETYKTKAQNAFKKQKAEQQSESASASSNQSELKTTQEELEKVKNQVRNLNEQLSDASDKVKSLEKENELIQTDYSNSLVRNTKLLNDIKQKDLEISKLNDELNEIKAAQQSESSTLLVDDLKLENLTITANYKEKIKQLTAQHCVQVDQLQGQLQESREETEKLNRRLNDLISRTSQTSLSISTNQPTSNNPNSNNHSPKSDDNNFILRSAERQQGEGVDRELLLSNPVQAYADADERRGIKSLKSLEQLLNDDYDSSPPSAVEQMLNSTNSITPNISSPNNNNDQSSSTNRQSFSNNNNNRNLINQIESQKVEINKGKIQLVHLNELLNESELNNQRLSDQITFLKEEIRRLERNQEREKSISNMEYLKNVVLRFLTFTNPQEKAQLLPVLSQMLKLSQEEQNAIMTKGVAAAASTGGSGAGAGSTLESIAGGWASYLPKW